MKLLVKKLHPNAILPHYAHPGDSGLDLFSVEEHFIRLGERRLIKTGIAIELPPNTEAQVRPRSGLALKFGLTVLNTPGTVDNAYRNEIGVILINHGIDGFHVTEGMKLAQLVIAPVITVDVEEIGELSDTVRGLNGFGSTGFHANDQTILE